MYEVDFLPVESDGESGSKCGDAIAIRFTYEGEGREAVVVIDGGYGDMGTSLVEHVKKYYDTSTIDLVISTHPDADHINGLVTVLEQADVRKLMVHRPRNHVRSLAEFSNIEKLDELIKTAENLSIPIIEPFEGAQEFGGQLTVCGPTEDYYVELLTQYLEEERTGKASARRSSGSPVWSAIGRKFERMLSMIPIETLSNDVETGPRNNMSVITHLKADGHNLLLTGDAGIPALDAAADFYESTVGLISAEPFTLFQVPHHGSRRNAGPDLLDRLLGERNASFGSTVAIISSAEKCKDHPSPKVINALNRRDAIVAATEGKTLTHWNDAPDRPGWGPVAPLRYLPEDD